MSASEPAVEARGLGRRFLIQGPAERGLRSGLMRRLRPSLTLEPLWALRGVDLTVQRGECVAVLGPNGAGKSTLLSVLSGLLPASEGTVAVRGRVSPFLRLGAGLYADLPVRDNILFAASLFGLTAREAAARLPRIAAFGGLEGYLDARLGALSSGYQARTALATALHADLDILLIDEVFAVGDMDFSAKCVERMTALRAEGRTFILATHDLGLAAGFCSRGLLLERGALRFDGPSSLAVAEYKARGARR